MASPKSLTTTKVAHSPLSPIPSGQELECTNIGKAILDDPSIDAVYIPLPNGLHYEWALKAIAKGKHVLLEKPATSNASEAESLFRHPLLKQPNAPVVMEAFHYRFQPTWQYFLSLVDRPNLSHVYSVVRLPSVFLDKNDIRFKYELAGGTVMDLGTYQLSVLRGVTGAEPEECLECTLRKCPPPNELCDSAVKAKFRFPGGIVGDAEADLQAGWKLTVPRVEVTHNPVPVPDDQLPAEQEKTRARKLKLHNYMVSGFWHRIDIEDEFVLREKSSGNVIKRWTTTESKKIYTFRDAGILDQPSEPYWLSYRHQLEQFINRVRGRQGSGLYVENEDTISQMKMVDMVYEKSDLPLRPTSKFELSG